MPSCPQDVGHDLSTISEEIEALDDNKCITRDPPKECVSIEKQTGDASSEKKWTTGLGSMIICLLRWQIKVQRLTATPINL